MILRVIKLTFAVVVLAVCFCGKNNGDGGGLRKNDSDTNKCIQAVVNYESAEGYPDEINCVINNYIAQFSEWEELTEYYPKSPMMDLLDHTESRSRVVSFRQFKINDKTPFRFWVEIWKMKSSADAKKLDNFCEKDPGRWELMCGYKSPRSYFVFNEYFILVNGNHFGYAGGIVHTKNQIIERCFEKEFCCKGQGAKQYAD